GKTGEAIRRRSIRNASTQLSKASESFFPTVWPERHFSTLAAAPAYTLLPHCHLAQHPPWRLILTRSQSARHARCLVTKRQTRGGKQEVFQFSKHPPMSLANLMLSIPGVSCITQAICGVRLNARPSL